MENNKLQELTQKLYNEGLEKGRSEADRLVAEAKAEAAKILAEARPRQMLSLRLLRLAPRILPRTQ